MSKRTIRVFSREFKLKVVRRMLAGENVSALARELKVLRKDLYVWRDRFRSGGPEALRGRGRPPKAAPASVVRSRTIYILPLNSIRAANVLPTSKCFRARRKRKRTIRTPHTP